jgi:hypothetical protein
LRGIESYVRRLYGGYIFRDGFEKGRVADGIMGVSFTPHT